jgi:heme-degrading monooxygenase HmoA
MQKSVILITRYSSSHSDTKSGEFVTILANTPKPPYYAVIFTSIRIPEAKGYDETANRMVELATKQSGFLGIESAREEIGITVSYWESLAAIKSWKANSEHLVAQKTGKKLWYESFKVRISKVEREYGI